MYELTLYEKDPDAVLDWSWDWKSDGWLLPGDAISSYAVVCLSGGIVVESVTEADGVVQAFLSGGMADTTAIVQCEVVTTGGRRDHRTIRIEIHQR